MDIDKGLIALIGLCCLLWPLVYFLAYRRVNRFVIFLLGASFACFGVALGLHSWESYLQGAAHFPARGTTDVPREQLPGLFWFSTIFWSAVVAGLALVALQLFRIAFMRRRRRA